MNGASSHEDHGEFAGWVIALLGAVVVVGKRVDRTVRMSSSAQDAGEPIEPRREALAPVYTYNGSFVPGREGLEIRRLVLPFLALVSVREIDLPEGTPTIPIATLLPGERADIVAGIRTAEVLLQQMRAAESGVIVAPASAMPTGRPR